MRSLWLKVWRDVVGRPMRSLLTILGVAAGVAGIVAITSAARNLVRAQSSLFRAISQADLVFWMWDGPAGVLSQVRADPRVADAELRLTYNTRWRSARSWQDMELVGMADLQDVRVNRFELLEGRYPGLGEMLLDVSAARRAAVTVGDSIAYRTPQGQVRYLTVSGISQSPSYLSSAITSTALGYVPARYMQRALNLSGYNQLLVRLVDLRDAQSVASRITQLLRRQGIQAGPPTVRSADQYAGKRELDALIMLMLAFSVVGVVLSAFLVYNTLSFSVAQQMPEIGVLKALGATRAHVLTVYMLEAAVYGLAGLVLGAILGSLGGWRLLAWIATLGNARVAFAVAPEGLFLAAVVGLGMTLAGAAVPVVQAARVSTRDAIESHGIVSDYAEGSWLTTVFRPLSALPLALLSVRNLVRRRRRSLATVVLIALATAAFVGAVATRVSVSSAISAVYRMYYADAWVWLGEGVTTQFEELFLTVDGVHAAEGWALADGIVGLAPARLWGMPADTTLYRPVLRSGRWFRADESDSVVVSAELAANQHLAVGDRVRMQAEDNERLVTVVGIATDNTIFLGGTLAGKAFLSRDLLGSLLGQEDRVGLFALGLSSREPVVADAILAEVERKFAPWRPSVQPVYLEIASARESSRLLDIALVVMVILVATVGALGMVNTLTLGVLERRREIGVLRSIGATDMAVMLMFVTEGLVLGLIGWVAGLVVGLPAGRLFAGQMSRVLFTIDYVVSPSAIVGSAVFCLALAVISSIGPAWGAARTSTDAALRYE